MRLILLGAPGAGKGSLAALLKERFNLEHVSTGDILREEMKNETDIGKEAKSIIAKGELVPDEMVTKLIDHVLSSKMNVSQGFMLDGFPRTKTQAEDLDKILQKLNRPLDYALCLEASLDMILKRLTGRRVCRKCGHLFHVTNKPPKQEGVCDDCGGELYQRTDDNEETIKKRMDVYSQSTEPMLDYYEQNGRLRKMDADLDTEVLLEHFTKLIDEDAKNDKH